MNREHRPRNGRAARGQTGGLLAGGGLARAGWGGWLTRSRYKAWGLRSIARRAESLAVSRPLQWRARGAAWATPTRTSTRPSPAVRREPTTAAASTAPGKRGGRCLTQARFVSHALKQNKDSSRPLNSHPPLGPLSVPHLVSYRGEPILDVSVSAPTYCVPEPIEKWLPRHLLRLNQWQVTHPSLSLQEKADCLADELKER